MPDLTIYEKPIDHILWGAAREYAQQKGVSLSSVIAEALMARPGVAEIHEVRAAEQVPA